MIGNAYRKGKCLHKNNLSPRNLTPKNKSFNLNIGYE